MSLDDPTENYTLTKPLCFPELFSLVYLVVLV